MARSGGKAIHGARRILGALLPLALTALLILAAPAAAEWQPATAVPGAPAPQPGTEVEVGISDDGGAAIAYRSGDQVRVATRETADDGWSKETLQSPPSASSSLDLEMNAAGDVAVGYLIDQIGGGATVAYKPAGGRWEPTALLDANTLNGMDGILDLAINSAGDVVAGWSAREAGTPPRNAIRAVVRRKAESWPAVYDTVAREDDETRGPGRSSLPRGAAARPWQSTTPVTRSPSGRASTAPSIAAAGAKKSSAASANRTTKAAPGPPAGTSPRVPRWAIWRRAAAGPSSVHRLRPPNRSGERSPSPSSRTRTSPTASMAGPR